MPNLENRLKLLIHFAVGETSSKSLISAVTILLLSKIFRLFAVLNDICYFLKITELFHIPYVILRDSFTGRMICSVGHELFFSSFMQHAPICGFARYSLTICRNGS